MAPPARHGRASLARYAVLAVPLAFAGLPVYLHSPDYYASEHGASLAALGIVLLALRAFDAVQDPVIGALSDRLHAHRRKVIVVGMALMAAGFWMVFHPLRQALLSWFAIGVLLCTSGYSVVSINYFALGGLWVSDTSGRTRITSWREGAGLAGLLAASAAPVALGSATDPDAAFHRLSLLYLPVLAVGAWFFFRWMASADIGRPSQAALGFRTTLASALGPRWNRRFFGVFLANAVAGSIPAALVLFFIRDRIQAPELTGLFLLLYFATGALSMPAWQVIAKKTGKGRAWLCSMWLAVATFCWAALLGTGDVAGYAIVCAMSGFALGADLALPPSMLADRIARQKDEAAASSYFSVMTFLTKSAFALATGITLPVLGLSGYQPGAVTDHAVTGNLVIAYAVVPSLMKVATALWLWGILRRHEGVLHENDKDIAGGRAGAA